MSEPQLQTIEKQMIECFVDAWLESDMKLYGNISYSGVMNFLTRQGLTEYADKVEKEIEERQRQWKAKS